MVIALCVGCGNEQQTSSSTVSRVPLHRLLLIGQQNINNLSVIQTLKNHFQGDPLFENVFDGMSTSETNRMSAMLDQHILGFFTQAGDEFDMDPDRSDFSAISIELTGYTVKLDTSNLRRVWYSSETINGTWTLNKDADPGACKHRHDSLTLNSNQFQSPIVLESYNQSEGKGCQLNCAVTYSYTVKVMDDDGKVIKQSEIIIPFKSGVIMPDED